MVRWFVMLLCVSQTALWAEPPDDRKSLERFLDEHLTLHYSLTSVLNTHPPDEGNNTGNLFNFVPHSHLFFRHSAVGFSLGTADAFAEDGRAPSVRVTLKLHPTGLIAEAERGEAHHILAKVVDRNYIEPALQRVFRRRLGESFVHLLDITVVDRISDRLADEILSRVPVTASVREFMVEIARALDDTRSLGLRAGLLLPSFGTPRDDTGRSLLDRRLVVGLNQQYWMNHPGHTLAVELTHLTRLPDGKSLRVTAGLQQAQDPDPTFGKTIRNTVFDEGATELSLEKVDSLYGRIVYAGEGFEAYGSIADNEGLTASAGWYWELFGRTTLAIEAARHEPDRDELTPVERRVETAYRNGLSAAVIRDLTGSLSAYAVAEFLDGTIGKRKKKEYEKLELGLVYRVSDTRRVGIAAYQVEDEKSLYSGLQFSMSAEF